MHYDLVEAQYLRDYVLWVRFSDGSEGEVDLESELYGEVFEPLKGLDLFKSFEIHPELKVLSWTNGADLAPEYLYGLVKKAA